MKAYTIWFTGLPSSGKTTLANELVKELKNRKISYVLLDDNKMRKILSPDLTDNKYEYLRHVIRLANVSYLITSSDVFNIVCTVAPKNVLRKYAKQLIKNFVEIYVSCPLEVCEERAKQKFNGFSSQYEEPKNPSITIDTQNHTITENSKIVLDFLLKMKIIDNY